MAFVIHIAAAFSIYGIVLQGVLATLVEDGTDCPKGYDVYALGGASQTEEGLLVGMEETETVSTPDLFSFVPLPSNETGNVTVTSWEQSFGMSEPRFAFAAVSSAIDNTALVYVFGGQPMEFDNNTIETLDSMEVYDGKGWKVLAPMELARSDHGGAIVMKNGFVYVLAIGGILGRTAGPCAVTKSVEMYDVANDTWTNASSMITARGGVAVASIELSPGEWMVYVVGGDTGCDGGPSAVMEVYSVNNDTWSSLTAMRTSRAYPAGVPLVLTEGTNSIMVVGGQGSQGSLASSEIYSVESNSWQEGPSLPEMYPLGLTAMQAVVIPNQTRFVKVDNQTLHTADLSVYVLGGQYNSDFVFGESLLVNVSDLNGNISTAEWSVGPPMVENRSYFAAITLCGGVADTSKDKSSDGMDTETLEITLGVVGGFTLVLMVLGTIWLSRRKPHRSTKYTVQYGAIEDISHNPISETPQSASN